MRQETFPQLRDRYTRDPKFKAIVDVLEAYMIQSQVTPYELRDAAYVASIIFAQRHIEPYAIEMRFPDEVNDIIKSMGGKL